VLSRSIFVVDIKTIVDKAIDVPTPTIFWEALATITWGMHLIFRFYRSFSSVFSKKESVWCGRSAF
jgi:hypothetical protein